MQLNRDRFAEGVARWTSRILMVAATVSLISLPLRRWQGVDVISDLFGVFNFIVEPSIFVVCLGFILAGAIRRRFRAAHTVLTIVMVFSVLDDLLAVIFSIVDPTNFGGYWRWRVSIPVAAIVMVIGLAVLVCFVMSRRAFPGRIARGSSWAAIGVLATGLVISFAETYALVNAFPRELQGQKERAIWSLRAALGDRTPTWDLHGHAGHHWIYVIASLVSTGALILAILTLLRANRPDYFLDTDQELAVRRLLARYGERDSLGYFATRRDRSVVFSPDGKAALAFRATGTISVACADPIGDINSWPGAVTRWLEDCRRHSLHPAVIGASAEGTRIYREAGLRSLTIGDEAIVHVADFTLRGKAMKPVRQAVNRVTAAGYTGQLRRYRDLSAEEHTTVVRLADEWLGDEADRGYAMALNRNGDPADERSLIATAHDRDGNIRALLSFVPWGTTGASLDLMRRDRDAENGLIEFLVATTVAEAPGLGVRRISLNFAAFRSVFSGAEQEGAGPITRALGSILEFGSRFYQIKSLYQSNKKYQPEWVPRTICYDPALTAARAGIAATTAEGLMPQLGPSFLVGPKGRHEQEFRTDPEFLAAVREIDASASTVPEKRFNEQQRVRIAKRQQLRDDGIDPYPVAVPRTASIAAVVAAHPAIAPSETTGHQVSVVGRVRAIRDLGGVSFAVLSEDSATIQALAQRPDFAAQVDLGDVISVTGEVVGSRSGELSVAVAAWQTAAKCLNPVPSGRLADDVRSRNRTLDLLASDTAVNILRQRSRAVAALRAELASRDFIEVETPMLQQIHGGAAARPFRTHINAYDMPLYLRIAPELYLKRLAVGGMQRIFELNRNFRNEGVDATHNPEFTALEVYQAFGDYVQMRELTHDLVVAAATAIHGTPTVQRPDGSTLDISGPWKVVTVHDAIAAAVGRPVTTATPEAELREICLQHGLAVASGLSAGQLVMELYERLVEKQTVEPTFYCDFPIEVSPLARTHRRDPALTEHWDLVMFGAELATAYSELTDPIEQRRRLTAQSLAAAGGDPEAMQLDEDFLEALSYGLPPTGGMGLGVDRLVMMLLGVSIRPTLSFPFVKPAD